MWKWTLVLSIRQEHREGRGGGRGGVQCVGVGWTKVGGAGVCALGRWEEGGSTHGWMTVSAGPGCEEGGNAREVGRQGRVGATGYAATSVLGSSVLPRQGQDDGTKVVINRHRSLPIHPVDGWMDPSVHQSINRFIVFGRPRLRLVPCLQGLFLPGLARGLSKGQFIVNPSSFHILLSV